MAFIAKADLYPSILQDELEEITQADDTLIEQAISSAVSEMRTYLYDAYDVDAIFAATGTDRHQLLVNFAADITIYILMASVQAGINMEDRRARYKRACDWLKMVKDDETYSDLPRREQTVQTRVVYGSNLKRNNYY